MAKIKIKSFKSADLTINSRYFPPVFHQRQLNSCTANCISTLLYHKMKKESREAIFIPSRLFIYYIAREQAGKIDHQNHGFRGPQIALTDCIRAVKEKGFCDEKIWPYDLGLFRTKPPERIYQAALKFKGFSFHALPNDIETLKATLNAGSPFLLSIKIFESFNSLYTTSSGMINLPEQHEKELGNHAIVITGYDDEISGFIFQNSLGPKWGNNGFGYLPYDYLKEYGFDIWGDQRSGVIGER